MNTKFLLLTAIIITAASCSKNDIIQPPVSAPPATVGQSVTDSMYMLPAAQTLNPQFYADVHGKTYTVTGTRNYAAYAVRNGDLLLQFTDSTVAGYTAVVSLRLRGKTAAGAAGFYQLAGNSGICVEMWQDIQVTPGVASWVQSSGCETVRRGTLQLNYDAATQTLSGRIDGLQYGIGFYLPHYFAGKPHSLAEKGLLSSGGSSRTHNIQFANVRKAD